MSDFIMIASLVTALLAVFFGPLVTLVIARRQVHADIVSANRQAWSNALRDAISEYLAKAMIARQLNARRHADASSIPRIEDIVRLNTRIELLLNPKKPQHAELIEQLTGMTGAINQQDPKNAAFNPDLCQSRVVDLAQAILKQEWLRVKQGN